jgi:hypothetical protein
MALCLQNCNRFKLLITYFREGLMKSRHKFLFIGILLLSFSTMARAQIHFFASPEFVTRDALRLEDFGLTESGIAVPYLFTLMITNVPTLENVSLMVEIFKNNELIASGTSDEFNIEEIGLNIPNQELFKKYNPYAIKMNYWENDFINQVLGMTKFPSAKYQLMFTLLPDGLVTNVVIDVTNPSKLDLIAPSDGEEISRLQPMFWWEADMHFFRLMVVEINEQSGVPNSANEFESHPYKKLDTYILVGSNGTIPNVSSYVIVGRNNYIYPSSATNTQHFETLEFGKIYYWMMVGYIDYQSNLQNRVESQIFSFTTMDDPGERSRANAMANLAQDLLLQFEQNLRDQFPAGIDLGNITPTGYVTINGVQVTWAQLQSFLQNARTGAIEILRAEIIESSSTPR